MTISLILGGARSGKSAHAERLAAASAKQVAYIATAQAHDIEMAERIGVHRQRRDASWTTVEEALALGDAIRRWSSPERIVLVDCLTVWLSNLLFSEQRDYPEVGRIIPPDSFHRERQSLLDALRDAAGEVILVSNEVGLGIVPQGAISRWFVDEAGRLNQAVAAISDRAVFIAAGLPMLLKGKPC
ncbi:bifunctional adenosylcobinamide kinase/adenosylcobinamide-phosphate guanylyltransferase [Noviherbaspirillum aerium]|uniref:bifunctional adenosylcobinamide kinase/adenosylcobinamide-phosphate guanylyltransferase n=1 Tax=Noviherbaspirillum aerium TaxID=2588497 RepID=UPI00124D138A|nr:bifunctional adenosylcobinamide kinase/adenosylcobinamide-phosphate guanylyltransferase [Noviherbaspirillum aerium]